MDFDQTNFGTLGILPQELRDKIYEYVIATGHISILRTSKALYKNMKLMVSKHGLYRMLIKYGVHPNPRFYLQRQFPNTHGVQNIEIHIKGTSSVSKVERSGMKSKGLAPVLQAVVGPIEKPICCRLKLEKSYHDPADFEPIRSFQLVIVFRTVDVEVGPFEFPLFSVSSSPLLI